MSLSSKKLFLCLFAVLIYMCQVKAQHTVSRTENYNRFQYGFGGKIILEFSPNPDHKFNYRLAATTGVASDFIAPWTHPSLNIELQVYSGGLGSRNNSMQRKKDKVTVDLITALTMTVGTRNQMTPTLENFMDQRYVPLSYFSDIISPSLQNPFGSSLSLGTNVIFSSDEKRFRQRVGFVNFNFFRRIQFSYYNDGGPGMSQLGLGDTKDRYHTGGGTLSYIGKRKALISGLRISYYKFTGYTLNSFEAANKMNLAYMDYKDEDQFYFNKSLYNFSISSFKTGLDIGFKYYNSLKYDAQHSIHWFSDAAYHMVPYREYPVVSVSYLRAYNKYGVR